MKLLKKIILIFAIIGISFSTVQAASFQETPKEEQTFSARTAFFSNGPGSKRVSVGICKKGVMQLISEDGDEILNFFQPCAFGGMTLDDGEDATLQLGVGIVEVMNIASVNVVYDSRKGDVYLGIGISLSFDDTFDFPSFK